MKKLVINISIISSLFFFSGCDYVDFPYVVEGPNGCTVAEPSFTSNPTPERKVLLEDFTGHRCGNCPQAGTAINNIISTHGDRVIAVAEHSNIPEVFTNVLSSDTSVNPSLKYVYDFRTTEATEIDAKFGVSAVGLPNGMVNRKVIGGSRVLGYTTWNAHVTSLLASPPDMDIQIKSFYDAATNTICAYTYVEALTNLSGDYKLVVMLTEDSIITWQKNYAAFPTDIPNYVHKHVLRKSLTGSIGVPVNTTTNIADGETFVLGYSTTINPGWHTEHMHVVAFVYNSATDEVIQAEEIKFGD